LAKEARAESVIAFGTEMNVVALLATRGLRARVIVSERVDPSAHAITRSWSVLRRVLYPRAHCVVFQTERSAQWARAFMPRTRVRVIANPVQPAAATNGRPVVDIARPSLAAVGRLVPQKGFDILLRAFAIAARQAPDWCLVIAGDGPQRDALRALAASLGLAERVQFRGVVDAAGLMRSSDAFVLASRYEGFPNALVEAMAAGVPVVATDCPSGPREITDGGRLGLLVPLGDEPALASAIARIMADPELRRELSAKGREVLHRYDSKRIVDEWELVARGIAPS
jgi:glycosyltransferase involved in cell wall biosynthesis